MAFKLGREGRSFKHSGNVKINRTPLDKGTIAEANMDGSISVDPSVKPNSPLYKRVMKHEMQHVSDMESGRAAYGDTWVHWEGRTYMRNNGIIDGPNGSWPEGHPNHPWEQEAIAAEKQ